MDAEGSKCIRKDQRMKGRVEERKAGGKYRKTMKLEWWIQGSVE